MEFRSVAPESIEEIVVVSRIRTKLSEVFSQLCQH